MNANAERLSRQLMDEADRIEKIDPNLYHMAAHELRSKASDVVSAGNALEHSKRERRKR